MQETRRRVLEGLADGPVSGPALADRLDVSRAAVWKHVEALRDAGFEVESREDGYVLAGVPEFGGAAVEYGLEAPFEVEYHDSIDSTNDRARELATGGAADVVVLADEQTGARGRLDREWSAPSGGVWMSVVCRPTLPPAQVPVYTLAAAVAVTEAVRDAGVDARIKWPNDVLVAAAGEAADGEASDGEAAVGEASDGEAVDGKSSNGEAAVGEASDGEAADGETSDGDGKPDEGDEKKLVGILTEMEGEADRVSWVVVGVGLNANVDADRVPGTATTIREEVGDVDRAALTRRVLERFDELRDDPESVLPAWRDLSSTLGRRVRVETPGGEVVGEAVDVEFPGTLVVATEDGRRRVTAGDCEHLRPV